MTAQIKRFLRPREGWRWLWGAGLGFPLLLGLVLIAGILISFSRSQYEPPKLFSVGQAARYQVNSPIYFEDERFWLVLKADSEFIALSDVDPTSRCSTPWSPNFEFNGRKGWFRDACRGSLYDVEGRCFDGPCTRNMDQFGILLQRTEVIVNFTETTLGAPPDFTLEPVNPSAAAP